MAPSYFGRDLYPELRIPSQDLAKQHQTVKETKISGTNISVITDQGQWTFALNEPVGFPRRPDGSTRNFIGCIYTGSTTLTPPPTSRDLAIGDVVDPADGLSDEQRATDPRLDPDFFEEDSDDQQAYLSDWYRTVPSSQRIVAMRAQVHTGIVTISLVRMDNGVRHKILVPRDQPISFPMHKAFRPEPPVQLPGVHWETHGPYVHRLFKTEAFFAANPNGGGRWPNSIPEYNPRNNGRMRPPIYMTRLQYELKMAEENRQAMTGVPNVEEWRQWEYMGQIGERHPKDLTVPRRRGMNIKARRPADPAV